MRQLVITRSITRKEDESLKKYFTDIRLIRLLTAEKELSLAQTIRNDLDPLIVVKAKEELTKANLRFVISVAKQYRNQGLALSDL
ncbi:MAG: RNA polymerase subunit sigma, partial [Candidatus Nomurabacteria bacterium]|nr:RNA polymerase subunit sigma [Candidatus Nomurabacteria bacterium]